MEQFRPDVVGGKYDPSLFDPSGEKLLVNSIFYTMQGEGMHTGTPAIFIRLAKCNLKCKFCDTEFERGELMSVDKVLTTVTTAAFVGHAQAPPMVVLTGGEPGIQNCDKLITALQQNGHTVSLETSGSVWAPWMKWCNHICISPKVPLMRIPAQLTQEVERRARGSLPHGPTAEFKWIVNMAFMTMYLRNEHDVYFRHNSVGLVQNYLQPESQSPEWTAKALEICKKNPDRYKLSIQTHKYIGVE